MHVPNTFPTVNGVWQQWSNWGQCDSSCGLAIRLRKRICTDPQNGGRNCEGINSDVQKCTIKKCPGDIGNLTFITIPN